MDQAIWRMSQHIWAPELHRIDGKWYIYFAASEVDDKWKLRRYALSNPFEDPTKGTWTEEGQVESNRDELHWMPQLLNTTDNVT